MVEFLNIRPCDLAMPVSYTDALHLGSGSTCSSVGKSI